MNIVRPTSKQGRAQVFFGGPEADQVSELGVRAGVQGTESPVGGWGQSPQSDFWNSRDEFCWKTIIWNPKRTKSIVRQNSDKVHNSMWWNNTVPGTHNLTVPICPCFVFMPNAWVRFRVHTKAFQINFFLSSLCAKIEFYPEKFF